MQLVPTHLVAYAETAHAEYAELSTSALSATRAYLESEIVRTPPSNKLDYLYARLDALDAVLTERS